MAGSPLVHWKLDQNFEHRTTGLHPVVYSIHPSTPGLLSPGSWSCSFQVLKQMESNISRNFEIFLELVNLAVISSFNFLILIKNVTLGVI